MSVTIRSQLIKILLLGLFDVFAIQFAVALGSRISVFLGIGIGVFTIIINIVFLSDRLYPWRWIVPALAGMFLLVVYPIGYSLVVAFTNYGDGHLLTKEQVIAQKVDEHYQPPDAKTYSVTVYRNAANEFRYWLVDEDGDTFVHRPDQPGLVPIAPDDPAYAERNEQGVPTSLDGFIPFERAQILQSATTLQNLVIEAPPNEIRVTTISPLRGIQAQELTPRWQYDPAADTLTNVETGTVYRSERGNFVTGEGDTRQVLQPGFPAYIGFDNFLRVITDARIRDPFWRVFLWTVGFAGGSVFLTLALGLSFAMLLNSRDLPLKPVFRSILIIPYAVPGWLVVTTWRGLLNPAYGPVNLGLESLLNTQIDWFANPVLVKVAILFVNMYLGFPYMMLISLGALQSIPGDMYEAATIDGANGRQQFRWITLPMLLVALAPLLVASFAFNFNNFTVIELFNNGGPPMSAATVAGHSDILLSYTYRLAFSGARGTDYGFAAAIGVFIFFIVGPITYFNFRLTRQFEEAAA